MQDMRQLIMYKKLQQVWKLGVKQGVIGRASKISLIMPTTIILTKHYMKQTSTNHMRSTNPPCLDITALTLLAKSIAVSVSS